MFTFEPRGTLSCELPDANSPLDFLDIDFFTCGFMSFSIGSGVGNGAGGAGGTGGGGGTRDTHMYPLLHAPCTPSMRGGRGSSWGTVGFLVQWSARV